MACGAFTMYRILQCRPIPFFLAKSSIIAVGSDPIDSRQIIGVRVSLSSHMARRSRITGSAYFGPIESAMYLRACDVVLSGHHDLQRAYRQHTVNITIRMQRQYVFYAF